VVLLDVSMPGRDGLSTLAAIRAMEGPKAMLPVLMLTAQSALAKVRRAAQLAALEYFIKGTFEIHDLLDHVDALVREG
jgi:DNA-binding response OmpR family regulator